MAEQKDSVLAKLDEIEARYCEIEKQIAEPEISSNPAKLIPLSKEQGKLRAMVTKYREYKEAVTGIEEAEQILADSDADEDFKALARDEMEQLEAKSTALIEEITNSFVMADDMDIELGHCLSGGGSDGNFTGALGLATLDGLGVAGAGAELHDARVAAVAFLEPGPDFGEEFLHGFFVAEHCGGLSAGGDVVLPLPQCDELFGDGPERLRFGERGCYAFVVYEGDGHVREQSLSVGAGASELAFFLSVSHL